MSKNEKSISEQLSSVKKLADKILTDKPSFSYCTTKQRSVQRHPGSGNICGNPSCLNCRQLDGKKQRDSEK